MIVRAGVLKSQLPNCCRFCEFNYSDSERACAAAAPAVLHMPSIARAQPSVALNCMAARARPGPRTYDELSV